MADRGSFQRKLAKFRKAPKRFFSDSENPALRALGALVPENSEAPGRARKRGADSGTSHRALIEQSGLFDAEHYFSKYPDVRRHTGDLIAHYLKHGVREGRSPNAMFDPHHYVRQAGIQLREHPLIHYIKLGEARGLLPHPRFDPNAYRMRYPDVAESALGLLEHYMKIGRKEGRITQAATALVPGELRLDHDLRTLSITVLVPVFNGGDHVRRCIESVLLHTRLPGVNLLLIDDASTDLRTRELLTDYDQLSHVTLLRNERNLGFTRTVNRGLQHASQRDVVLLNSDTVVGPGWLEALALVAYGGRNVATATALSDNAGAFSTPASGENRTQEFLPVQDAARLSQRAAPGTAHMVPTGNGFCMYMRRAAIDATGPLDEEHFPRGYGEENDWCMRARERGFVHAIAFRSYVHHVNAVSFGADAKQHLRDRAREMLDRLHPDYGAQVRRAFSAATPLAAQREVMSDALDKARRVLNQPPRPRILFVVSTLTGGTPLTNEDLMRGVSHLYEPMLLICDSREMQLFDYSQETPQALAYHSLSESIAFVPHTSVEYDAVISDWLSRFNVELVHIRHIAWHGLGLVAAAKRQGLPVVFSLHDFYTVDPSVNLTNGTDRWSDTGITKPYIVAPLWTRRDAKGLEAVREADPEAFLALWKRRMNLTLSQSDAFVTTSPFAKTVFAKNLPVLHERTGDFHVIPHGRDFEQFLAPARAPKRREPLRVLLPGNITESKGLGTILEIIRLDEDGEIEFHLVGTAKQSLLDEPRVRNHGPYQRGDFNKLVSKIKPHVGIVVSIWPETYCHTLTECWAAGLPVVGSNLGAVSERIHASQAGWTVDPFDAAGILALLRRIRVGQERWQRVTDALAHWRQTAAEWDVAAMAERYLDIYASVRRNQLRLSPRDGLRGRRARKRVALVIRGHYPHSMPTSHVRIATQVGQAAGNVDYDWVDGAELARNGLPDYDGVIVCRNAGPASVFLELTRQCKALSVPIVLDLDDDLLNVPPSKDPGGVYPAFAPALRELLASASLTTLSTDPLKSLYARYARDVRIVPNKLDPRYWFEPLTGEPVVLSEITDNAADTGGLRVVYMGSATHSEDLEFILPVFQRLREVHGVQLYLIGVTREPPPGVIVIKPPSSRYDHFIVWFRAISKYFDVAVAPLLDTPFNRAKSALKFMEYAAAGIPVVASHVGPYSELVRDGVDGILVDNDEESWFQDLSALVINPELRNALAHAARVRAEREFACRSCIFDELPWDQWAALAAPDSAEPAGDSRGKPSLANPKLDIEA